MTKLLGYIIGISHITGMLYIFYKTYKRKTPKTFIKVYCTVFGIVFFMAALGAILKDNWVTAIQAIVNVVLVLVLIPILVKMYEQGANKKQKTTEKQNQEETEEQLSKGKVTYPYKLTQSVLSQKEGYFYRDVRPIADKLGLIVFTKMRLADLLEVPKGTKDYTKWFNRIKAKHIDFIFVDKEYHIRLLVEVDDPTHNRPDRQARDEAVDEMFRQVGLEVLHLRAWGKQYGAEDLETIITNALNVQESSSGK